MVLFSSLIGCGTRQSAIFPEVYSEAQPNTSSTDVPVNNLIMLCKVWGFAKYTHPAFLTGEMCWDEELLGLIPIIFSADEGDVKDILYDWLLSLGDDGYYWMVGPSSTSDSVNVASKADWINESFLGQPLATILSGLNGSHAIGLRTAPVFFDSSGLSIFRNQDYHIDMDFSSYTYRLLGLFRLWNAMEYYFPHIDTLDEDWSSLLAEFIPRMLEGNDRLSYEMTLMALSSHLRDVHLQFRRLEDNISLAHFMINELYGVVAPPALFMEIDGELTVFALIPEGYEEGQLMPGDIVVKLNDAYIDEIISSMSQNLSLPNDKLALNFLMQNYLSFTLRQIPHDTPMKMVVIRDGTEVNLVIEVEDLLNLEELHHTGGPLLTRRSHELLENNIGLINPGTLSFNANIRGIMMDFSDTNGLIIDMRQEPSHSTIMDLERYLLDRRTPFVNRKYPSRHVPGTFVMRELLSGADRELPYDKNVVILMNEFTRSFGEHMVMSLRNGPNVTVIGSTSMGTAGFSITTLPLPGGISMSFAGIGMYDSENRQIHRIGLSPDVYVHRTRAGILEGRDELMEFAIAFLIGND